jgi:hypothetical protein
MPDDYNDEWTRTSGGQTEYFKKGVTEKGKTWVGTYVKKYVDDTYGHFKYVIDCVDKMLDIGGKNIDEGLEHIPFGKKVKILYVDSIIIQSGKFKGKDFHVFEVFVAGGLTAAKPKEEDPSKGPLPLHEQQGADFSPGPEDFLPQETSKPNNNEQAPTRVTNPAYKRNQAQGK